jgi:hypothetical protein
MVCRHGFKMSCAAQPGARIARFDRFPFGMDREEETH